MQNPWPQGSFYQPLRNERGWLQPSDDYLRLFLARPELALVPESCEAERALHAALVASPSRPVAAPELQAFKDADARDNYTLFLRFRDGLLAAGTLEAYYLGLFPRDGTGHINIPPLFIDLVAQAILHNMLDGSTDAYEMRAAEMLFRPQRISTQDGQVLSGDLEVIDMFHETGGVGDFGRFLAEAGAPVAAVQLQVLNDGNAVDYWQQAGRHRFLLDLTHEVSNDLSHGLVLTMVRARSGLKALAGVLQKWVSHFLGVTVTIRPVQKVDDEAWRWHVGLDVEATALLNDLYEGREVEPARLQRLVSLFRLDFADPREMRADVAGKPVYLGLMMNADGVVRLKPQNLLVNLPLPAAAS
ncbi:MULTISPECIES: DUF6352 family protein [unclassified Polaromonas]|jgi:hypothetical protein|uniref:DUF6352 family protein n=1 Tax=unclassified Polaromonas TaxID=2638319 RepID=UPI000F07AB92|nr:MULTISPECIES: DUF6352 family protein [unclassified Polaromonas]AYQ27275.1 hypothetical protein DT070_04060 [Polaromonas sp. SP1]QGJ17883.1 hypothetical protein F7R28_05385 [Polaromonas sp. Pch-P]